MTRRIRWTTRAANQLQEAATYLEHERKGTGLPFVDQVEAVLHQLEIAKPGHVAPPIGSGRTYMAQESRWAIRSAPPAEECWPRWPAN